MTKQSLIFIIFPFILLGGCNQLSMLNNQSGSSIARCLLPEKAVQQLLEDEHQYINANKTQRLQMLSGVKNNPARLANLLSSVGNDQASLEKALQLFNQLPLLPNGSCTVDRYLYLRLRQTQAHLTTIEELNVLTSHLNTAKLTIETQQQQIDALTQIEQAITRQREEP